MSVEDYREHFEPLLPPEDVHAIARDQLAHCPVAHSDKDGGFWVIGRHADLMRVMQDQEGFASGGRGVRIPHDPDEVERPPMLPIDSNPPIHRQVRQALNPFLAPNALAVHEPEFRRIIGELIDAFAAKGECDIATDLAKIFPAQITLQVLFGIDDPDELARVRAWVRSLSYDMFRSDPEVLGRYQQDWTAWCQELIDRRREAPRRLDIIDAILNVTIEDGRRLTDDEIIGTIQILIKGGFNTTSDATSNIVIRLIEDPDLEALLREKPELIPDAIEEILRLEPPVTARPRRCTRDTDIGGRTIRAGERVLASYVAANVDPEEFEDPEAFDLNRKHNKVVTFGAGPHRCIGSNMARMGLRLVTEELLARITGPEYDENAAVERVSFSPSSWRAVDNLPITFTQVG